MNEILKENVKAVGDLIKDLPFKFRTFKENEEIKIRLFTEPEVNRHWTPTIASCAGDDCPVRKHKEETHDPQI